MVNMLGEDLDMRDLLNDEKTRKKKAWLAKKREMENWSKINKAKEELEFVPTDPRLWDDLKIKVPRKCYSIVPGFFLINADGRVNRVPANVRPPTPPNPDGPRYLRRQRLRGDPKLEKTLKKLEVTNSHQMANGWSKIEEVVEDGDDVSKDLHGKYYRVTFRDVTRSQMATDYTTLPRPTFITYTHDSRGDMDMCYHWSISRVDRNRLKHALNGNHNDLRAQGKCFLCHKPGHIKRNCPLAANDERGAPPLEVTRYPLCEKEGCEDKNHYHRKKGDGKFKGELNGAPRRFAEKKYLERCQVEDCFTTNPGAKHYHKPSAKLQPQAPEEVDDPTVDEDLPTVDGDIELVDLRTAAPAVPIPFRVQEEEDGVTEINAYLKTVDDAKRARDGADKGASSSSSSSGGSSSPELADLMEILTMKRSWSARPNVPEVYPCNRPLFMDRARRRSLPESLYQIEQKQFTGWHPSQPNHFKRSDRKKKLEPLVLADVEPPILQVATDTATAQEAETTSQKTTAQSETPSIAGDQMFSFVPEPVDIYQAEDPKAVRLNLLARLSMRFGNKRIAYRGVIATKHHPGSANHARSATTAEIKLGKLLVHDGGTHAAVFRDVFEDIKYTHVRAAHVCTELYLFLITDKHVSSQRIFGEEEGKLKPLDFVRNRIKAKANDFPHTKHLIEQYNTVFQDTLAYVYQYLVCVDLLGRYIVTKTNTAPDFRRGALFH